MERVIWKWDAGTYVPFCPHCQEPAYQKGRCLFCGERFLWVEPSVSQRKVVIGEYEAVQAPNHHLHLYKNGTLILHASCARELTAEEIKQFIENHKKENNTNDNEA